MKCVVVSLVVFVCLISAAEAPRSGKMAGNEHCDAWFLAGQVSGFCTTSIMPSSICCHYLSVIFNATLGLSCATVVTQQAEMRAIQFTEQLLLEEYVKCSISEALASQRTGNIPDAWATCPRAEPCPQQEPASCPEQKCPELKPTACLQQQPRDDHSTPFWKETVQFAAAILIVTIIGYYVVKVLKRIWSELITWNWNIRGRAIGTVESPPMSPSDVFTPSAAVPILAAIGVSVPPLASSQVIELAAVHESAPLVPNRN